MSRSTVATKEACDLTKAAFHGGLLRVTDPRSDRIAQPAKSYGHRVNDALDANLQPPR